MYRWHKKKAEAAHTDDWLITYVDMISLLLCFFAIFIVVLSKKNATQKIAVQEIVEAVKQIPQPMKLEPQLPLVQPPTKLPDIFQGNMPFHDVDEDEPEVPAPAPAKAEAPAVEATSVTDTPSPLPPLPADTKSPAPAENEAKGDRIKVYEVSSAAFFGSGSATLTNPGIAILQSMTANLKSDEFKDYRITVEGHTDDTPIHTLQFPSNWELSTARASAVVHYFLDQGIPAQRLRAAGYADTFSKAPNRDAGGKAIPTNQAQNRRVVIKLEKIETN